MQQTIQQRNDTGSVGEDFVPLFEWSVGCEDHWLVFVAAIDYFVKQVGSLVVKGQIPDFINSQKSHVGIAAQFAATSFRSLTMQFFEQRRGGSKQH